MRGVSEQDIIQHNENLRATHDGLILHIWTCELNWLKAELTADALVTLGRYVEQERPEAYSYQPLSGQTGLSSKAG